jgi:hypothetical protein
VLRNVSYSYQRHRNIVKDVCLSTQGKATIIGQSNDNNPIDLLTFGEEQSHKKKIWIIARQHPGETMAQWFIEGLIKRLISTDIVAKELLERSVFYIVPNMNPDGSILGNHRTNSKGFNLNRQWQSPSENDCPEVYYVQQKMSEKGVDLFLDIHGDEEIPHSFIMSAGNSCKINNEAKRFKENFVLANDNFQTEIDYNTFINKVSSCCGYSGCGAKSFNKATDYVAHTFDCLAMLLEMPFIEDGNTSSKVLSSSVDKSIHLGHSILEPILATLKTKV